MHYIKQKKNNDVTFTLMNASKYMYIQPQFRHIESFVNGDKMKAHFIGKKNSKALENFLFLCWAYT